MNLVGVSVALHDPSALLWVSLVICVTFLLSPAAPYVRVPLRGHSKRIMKPLSFWPKPFSEPLAGTNQTDGFHVHVLIDVRFPFPHVRLLPSGR